MLFFWFQKVTQSEEDRNGCGKARVETTSLSTSRTICDGCNTRSRI